MTRSAKLVTNTVGESAAAEMVMSLYMVRDQQQEEEEEEEAVRSSAKCT